MVKTITDTVVEEKKFTKEAVRILTSLGCSTFDCTQEELDRMMAERGYSKGYNGTWFMSDDVNSETETRA